MARVIPGLALAAGWLLLLFFGTPLVFSFVMIVMALIGSKEYVRMVVKTHPEGSRNLSLIPLLTLPVVGVIFFDVQGGMQLGLMTSFICVTAYILFNYTKTQDIFRLFSQSMFGVVYVGCLFAFLT